MKIRAGLHYGTVRVVGVVDGPPLKIEQLAMPQQLVDIWAFDTLVCNIDRGNHGNILMQPTGNGLQFDLIAADQSDCFCGAGSFGDGSWCNGFKARGCAESAKKVWAPAVYSAGKLTAIDSAVRKVKTALQSVGKILGMVPAEWWPLAGVQAKEVYQRLIERADRLPALLNRDQWIGIDKATEGGHEL
jgi:hypothetical protein